MFNFFGIIFVVIKIVLDLNVLFVVMIFFVVFKFLIFSIFLNLIFIFKFNICLNIDVVSL